MEEMQSEFENITHSLTDLIDMFKLRNKSLTDIVAYVILGCMCFLERTEFESYLSIS